MAHVFSTLATDVTYVEWKDSGNDLKMRGREVTIKGGTGVANDRFVTPLGIATEVDDADLAVLENDSVFKMHKANGFVRIEKKSADPEKVAADMKLNDPSSPLTPSSPELSNERAAKVKEAA